MNKVRREQAVGTEDVKVTAMNMYKYKEGLRLYKRWPCSTYILNRVNWIECNVTWSARFLSQRSHGSYGIEIYNTSCYTTLYLVNSV